MPPKTGFVVQVAVGVLVVLILYSYCGLPPAGKPITVICPVVLQVMSLLIVSIVKLFLKTVK